MDIGDGNENWRLFPDGLIVGGLLEGEEKKEDWLMFFSAVLLGVPLSLHPRRSIPHTLSTLPMAR